MPTHALRTSAPAVALQSAAPSVPLVAVRPVAVHRSVIARLLAVLTVLVAVATLGACTAPSTTKGQRIANIAYSHLGARYAYGAAGPSTFDCSGLVQYTYRQAGVAVPRTSYSLAVAGRGVSPSAAMPGDVVILGGGSHVGIYVGGGQMIDAPHSGAVVTRRAIYASYSIRRLY
ncbi:MAG TPA: C40 family peptidase [Frankiaceae bacterium]|nr:C40 family peptidase [Frankiaceae bacterium]